MIFNVPPFAGLSVGIWTAKCGLEFLQLDPRLGLRVDDREILECFARRLPDLLTDPLDTFRMVHYEKLEPYSIYYFQAITRDYVYENTSQHAVFYMPLSGGGTMLMVAYFRVGGGPLTQEEAETALKVLLSFRFKPTVK